MVRVILVVLFLSDGSGDDAVDAALEGFLLEEQAVLVPNEVGNFGVKFVTLHASFEQIDNVLVVRVGCEGEASAIVHELLELGRLVQTELIDGNLLLLALDVIIFFILRASWETLPRERPTKEIKKHMTDRFQIVSSTLLVANMGADRGVPGCTSQVLALTERNVLTFAVFIALG